MSDANEISPEQRRQAADMLCTLVRAWLDDPETTFTISMRRGFDSRLNRATGVREMEPNGTATLVLEINGGARDAAGPDVLPISLVVR